MASASRPQRILIVSGHPLFGAGLRSLLHERGTENAEVVEMAFTTDEAVKSLSTLKPDIVIVDYDDKAVNREEFLARFVAGGAPCAWCWSHSKRLAQLSSMTGAHSPFHKWKIGWEVLLL